VTGGGKSALSFPPETLVLSLLNYGRNAEPLVPGGPALASIIKGIICFASTASRMAQETRRFNPLAIGYFRLDAATLKSKKGR
jgi:hypothetical protein